MAHDEIPERVKRRVELSALFYPLDRNAERRWGRTLGFGFDAIVEKLQILADERRYVQEIPAHHVILWKDKSDFTTECMFCLINDVTNLDLVEDIFKQIRLYEPVFAYAFVNQAKDGDGVFDIFRFSRFSYLEHCNRVRAPKKRRTP